MSDGTRGAATTAERLQSILAKHRAFWARSEGGLLRSAGVFAPSAPVTLRSPDGGTITRCERLEPDMIDPGLMAEDAANWDPDKLDSSLPDQGQFLISVGLGDILPHSRPIPKIPWIEAMLGCPVKMTDGQVWSERYEGDPEDVIRKGAHFEHNPWLELYVEFLRQLQSKVGDRFPVSANTLFRGNSDLAAAVMGVSEAAMSWIEQPRFMARLLRVCADANLAAIEAGYKVVHPFQGGYLCGYGVWAPQPILLTQADHSSLLSASMYAKQILPFDREVFQALPYSVIHLHNPGLHVVPHLVELPELTAIECVMDPYPKPERKPFEIAMLQLAQQYKPLFFDVNVPSVEEAEYLLSNLSPRGLCFNPRFDPALYASLPTQLPGSDTWLLG